MLGRAVLLMDLASAQRQAGDTDAAERDTARRRRHRPSSSATACSSARPRWRAPRCRGRRTGAIREKVAVIEEALEVAARGRGRAPGQAPQPLGSDVAFLDAERHEQLADEAVAAARRSGDSHAIAIALASWAFRPRPVAELAAAREEIARRAEESSDLGARLSNLMSWVTDAMVGLGPRAVRLRGARRAAVGRRVTCAVLAGDGDVGRGPRGVDRRPLRRRRSALRRAARDGPPHPRAHARRQLRRRPARDPTGAGSAARVRAGDTAAGRGVPAARGVAGGPRADPRSGCDGSTRPRSTSSGSRPTTSRRSPTTSCQYYNLVGLSDVGDRARRPVDAASASSSSSGPTPGGRSRSGSAHTTARSTARSANWPSRSIGPRRACRTSSARSSSTTRSALARGRPGTATTSRSDSSDATVGGDRDRALGLLNDALDAADRHRHAAARRRGDAGEARAPGDRCRHRHEHVDRGGVVGGEPRAARPARRTPMPPGG